MGLTNFFTKKKKELKERNSVNVYKMYGNLLFSHITKGLTEKREPLDKVSVQLGYNRVVTKNEIHYYIQVASMNSELDDNLLSVLRDTARNQYGRRVAIDMISRNIPHHIKWSSRSMKGNVDIWRNIKKKNSSNKTAADEEGFSSAVMGDIYNRGLWRENSWKYFQDCQKKGTEVTLTFIVFRLRIPVEDEEYAFLLFNVLDSIFVSADLGVRQLNTYLYDAMNIISPFKHEEEGFSKRLIAERCLTTKVISAFTPITQGRINQGNILLGNDRRNRQGVYLDTHPKGNGGTNILVVGATGSGKSFLIKNCLEQVHAFNDFIYITDYEGNEYTAFGEEYGALFLDLKGRDGRYYEPLRLCSLTGVPDIDQEILPSSINGVYELMAVLLGHPPTSTQRNLLSMAMQEYAKGFGVDYNDESTWALSKNMTVKGLLPKLKAFSKSKEMIMSYGQDLIELANTMELYFDGVYKYMFQNPISFEELKNEKIIITRFGSFNTGSVTGEDAVDLKIKQLTMIQLNYELARYRKSRTESFMIVFEELQRYLQHTGSLEWVNASWTGIRKCNGTCVGIINDPSKLNKGISALINNSEYFIVGRTEDLQGLGYMFETPKLQGAEPLVKSLMEMKNYFLFKYGHTTSIFKCEVPKAYANSPIFKTRNDEVGDS